MSAAQQPGVSFATRHRRGKGMPERRYYTIGEVAAIYGVSAPSLYRLVNAGAFPAVRVGNRVCVPRQAVDEMETAAIANQTVVAAEDWVPDGDDLGEDS